MNFRNLCLLLFMRGTKSFLFPSSRIQSNNFYKNILKLFDFSFLGNDLPLTTINIPIYSPVNSTENPDPDLNWYVIGETASFSTNKLKKITVWNKDYLVWKDKITKEVYVMDDDCSHKGAALSGGHIHHSLEHGSCAVCPYHGYEFAGNGSLVTVPGLSFESSPCKNQRTYPVMERNGWIYLNTVTKSEYIRTKKPEAILFEEPEAKNPDFSPIFLNVIFKAYSRIVSENSLDVMHIGFVHTFGNREFPSPLKEVPPQAVSSQYHYRTEYDYLSGSKSFAKKLFGFNQLKIQNEFALPHTTVARILFGPFISTVITFATPINITHSQLFVKTYRNFWRAPVHSPNPLDKAHQAIGDYFTKKMMWDTVLQDKAIVEGIRLENADGKFNMKYDKLSNTYRTFYKKWIHKVE